MQTPIESVGYAARATAKVLPVLPMLVCSLMAACVCTSPALAEPPLSWSSPVSIDPQPTPLSGVILHDVSCASPSLCVAVDYAGNVVSSTDPDEGAGAWAVADIDAANNLDGVSCTAPSLCVAVDSAGNVVSSTDPAGGAGTWTVANVDPHGRGINGVSCPSVSLCVAVDSAGDVLSSTDPTGGVGAWTVTGVDLSSEGYMGANDVYTVSCASVSLCVAADFRGNFLTSTDPTGGAGAWTVAPVDTDNAVYSVSCPSSSLCVAGDWIGDLLTSTAPTGGVGTWTAARVDPNPEVLNGGWHINGVSCPSTSLCVAVDERGNVFTSTGPAGGMDAWTIANVDGANHIQGVSCPSTSLCVAVDAAGNAIVGIPPVPPPMAVTLRARSPLAVRARVGHVRLAALLAHGLPVAVRCSQACTATIVVRLAAGMSRRAGLSRATVKRRRKPREAVIGRATVTLGSGVARTTNVQISSVVRRRLRRFSHLRLTATTTATAPGVRAVTSATVNVTR